MPSVPNITRPPAAMMSRIRATPAESRRFEPGLLEATAPLSAKIRSSSSVTQTKDLGIAESGLRRWMAQADIDEGKKDGLTSDERAELVRLRREKRVLEMEVEILKRASAYFARENVLP